MKPLKQYLCCAAALAAAAITGCAITGQAGQAAPPDLAP